VLRSIVRSMASILSCDGCLRDWNWRTNRTTMTVLRDKFPFQRALHGKLLEWVGVICVLRLYNGTGMEFTGNMRRGVARSKASRVDDVADDTVRCAAAMAYSM